MKQDFHTLLSKNIESPRSELSGRILENIHKRQARLIARKFWASVTLGIASIVGLFPIFIGLADEIKQSGFSEYVSVAFGQGGILSTYSSDLLIAIGESIPAISIIIASSVTMVALWSLRNIIRQSRSPHFTLAIN